MNPIDQINLINANMTAQSSAATPQGPQSAAFGPGQPAPQPAPQPVPQPVPQQIYQQPYPGQPYTGQPYPGQIYQGQQPYTGQPYPAFSAPQFSVRIKDPRKTGGRRTFGLMGLLLVAQVAVSFLVQLGLMVVLAAAGLNIYGDSLGLIFMVSGLSPICTALPFLLYMMFGKKDYNQYLRFERPGFLTGLLCVFAGLGVSIAGNYPAFFLRDLMQSFGAKDSPSVLGNGGDWTNFVVEILGVAVLVPLVEEFAFRGVVFSALRKYGTGFAIAGSAVIFGIAHMELSSVLFALIAGLAMGWVYARTNNLWLTVMIHALNNGIAVAGSYAELLAGEHAVLLQELLTIVHLGLGLICSLLLIIFRRRLLGKKPGPAPEVTTNFMPALSFGEGIGCTLKSPVFWALLCMVGVQTAMLFL